MDAEYLLAGARQRDTRPGPSIELNYHPERSGCGVEGPRVLVPSAGLAV